MIMMKITLPLLIEFIPDKPISQPLPLKIRAEELFQEIFKIGYRMYNDLGN
jgi:hypothetical protein